MTLQVPVLLYERLVRDAESRERFVQTWHIERPVQLRVRTGAAPTLTVQAHDLTLQIIPGEAWNLSQ